MRSWIKYLCLTFSLTVFPSIALHAADTVAVSVTGTITAEACTVSSELSSGYPLDLGTFGRTKFQTAGDAGDWKTFSLGLINCPSGTTRVTATFSGTADSNDATLFSNTNAGKNPATNVAVQIRNGVDQSTVLSNNSTMTVSIDSAAKTATFPLEARLYTATGETTPGDVSTTVLVDFTYQ